MPAPVIYIKALPGVGKLTIARALQLLLPESQILHNHELIDPVEKHIPRTSARYSATRAEYRQARLKPIHQDPKERETIWIFMDSQMDYNKCVSDYTDLCSSFSGGKGWYVLGRRFYSVILECEEKENCRRLQMAGRGGKANGKLTDVDILKDYRSRGGVHRFEDRDEIVLDVIRMKAEEAARKVKEFVERRAREGRSEEELAV